MGELSYQLASWPDEDVVVGEILLDDEHVASVFRRGEAFEVTIYHREAERLTLNMDDLESVLSQIRERLLS